MVERSIMAEEHGGAELVTSWQPGSTERMPILASFFLLPLLFHLGLSLLNGVVHTQGRSSLSVILSGNALTDRPRSVLY
jgi:hypothetical protein